MLIRIIKILEGRKVTTLQGRSVICWLMKNEVQLDFGWWEDSQSDVWLISLQMARLGKDLRLVESRLPTKW